MTNVEWEPIAGSLWGEPLLSMRFIALGPHGEWRRWPDSRLQRLWMRLRGWMFIRDSLIEMQQATNLRQATLAEILFDKPSWVVPRRWLSKEELRP